MQESRVSDIHFAGTHRYGYNDMGRDTLEEVYARAFHGEDALVRPQLISGTHALTVALWAASDRETKSFSCGESPTIP